MSAIGSFKRNLDREAVKRAREYAPACYDAIKAKREARAVRNAIRHFLIAETMFEVMTGQFSADDT